MKKIVFIIAISLGMLAVVFAQVKPDVIARASKQDNFIRLVFESEETFIKNANVSLSGTHLTIQFPSEFNLSPQKGFVLENAIKDRYMIINLKEPFEMKVLKLSSPARLVVDISNKAEEAKPQEEISLPQKVFVIDAGHGGYDFGITDNDLKEKDIALLIAKDIEGTLIKKGKKVFLTKKGDQYMSLKDRAVFANQKSPEIFLSVHVSSSGNFAVYTAKTAAEDSGSAPDELYSLSARQRLYVNKSKALAEGIIKTIKEEFNLNIIQREMSLPLLNSVGAPAVLVEVPSFKIMNYDQKTRARLAEAVIKGFSYYGR